MNLLAVWHLDVFVKSFFFSSISFFLNLWTRTCSSVIFITISNYFSAANISNNVLRNFSSIYLTYSISLLCLMSLFLHITSLVMSHCYSSHEVKTCWKCIHLFRLVSTNRLYGCYVKQWLAHFSRYCTSDLLVLIFLD